MHLQTETNVVTDDYAEDSHNRCISVQVIFTNNRKRFVLYYPGLNLNVSVLDSISNFCPVTCLQSNRVKVLVSGKSWTVRYTERTEEKF